MIKGIISIDSLAIDCIIGCMPLEREKSNRILIDLKLECDISPAAKTDDINHALNYVSVAALLTEVAIASKCYLLESLVIKCCSALFYKFDELLSIDIQISKPGAIPKAKNTSVSLRSSRMDWHL